MSYDEAAERLCHAADMYREAYDKACRDESDEAQANFAEARSELFDQASRFVQVYP